MKKLLYLISAIMLGLTPFTIINCEEVPAGLVTSVEGEVWDSVKHKPLEGVKVLLVPCYYTWGSVPKVCGDAIDSARTSASGQFKFELTTDGRADAYEVVVWRDSFFFSNFSEEVTIGENNLITLYARELSRLKVNLEIRDNPIGEIQMYTAAASSHIVNQSTRDTVIHTTFLPVEINTVAFRVYVPNMGTKYRLSIDTFDVSTTDTTYFRKIVETPLDWPFAP